MPPLADESVRVLVVDDHAVVRAGVRTIVESAPGMCMVGEAHDRASAMAAVRQGRPDIILLDLDIPGTHGLDLLMELRSAAGAARVVILTGVLDSAQHLSALRLGAEGLVLKEHAPEVLLKAIEQVHRGELWFDRLLLRHAATGRTEDSVASDPEAPKIASLTKREREVIALLGEGRRNRDIGDRLFISEGTVRRHMASIFQKLGTSDRFELIMYAYRHGLAKPPA